jgi:hypothetical protein
MLINLLIKFNINHWHFQEKIFFQELINLYKMKLLIELNLLLVDIHVRVPVSQSLMLERGLHYIGIFTYLMMTI